ncbi:hypothetical protein [Streptomyces sp. TLI_171]|uniref:hypothetical protein n=1 Tax=Streptomyces sp. TLI_171 TaxID=1938859 RepID=UPI000C37CCA7|nr:hypothetical protein [Streptomyces sp. TLI_171]RKE02907.1 site-specific recombinase XerD [Streptomyces sp. TLI_171]
MATAVEVLPARATADNDDLDVLDGELLDAEPGRQLALLDDGDLSEELTEEAAADLVDARSERTSKTYAEQWRYFVRWCAETRHRPGPKTAEKVMAAYISHLRLHGGRENTGAAVSSLRLAMAAIRDANARAGHENWPPKNATSALIRKQSRRFAAGPDRRPVKSSPPLDQARITHLGEHTPDDTLDGLRDHLILRLGYWTRARRSEQSNHRIDSLAFEWVDLEVKDETGAVVGTRRVKQMIAGKRTSKNDKWSTGKEYTVRDPAAVDYAERYLAMLALFGQAEPEMPLLRGVTRAGALTPVSEEGIGLTGHSINRILKRMIARTPGFDAPDATSHGLRAGVPADLGAAGHSPLKSRSSPAGTGRQPAWSSSTPRPGCAGPGRVPRAGPSWPWTTSSSPAPKRCRSRRRFPVQAAVRTDRYGGTALRSPTASARLRPDGGSGVYWLL